MLSILIRFVKACFSRFYYKKFLRFVILLRNNFRLLKQRRKIACRRHFKMLPRSAQKVYLKIYRKIRDFIRFIFRKPK